MTKPPRWIQNSANLAIFLKYSLLCIIIYPEYVSEEAEVVLHEWDYGFLFTSYVSILRFVNYNVMIFSDNICAGDFYYSFEYGSFGVKNNVTGWNQMKICVDIVKSHSLIQLS